MLTLPLLVPCLSCTRFTSAITRPLPCYPLPLTPRGLPRSARVPLSARAVPHRERSWDARYPFYFRARVLFLISLWQIHERRAPFLPTLMFHTTPARALSPSPTRVYSLPTSPARHTAPLPSILTRPRSLVPRPKSALPALPFPPITPSRPPTAHWTNTSALEHVTPLTSSPRARPPRLLPPCLQIYTFPTHCAASTPALASIPQSASAAL